MKSFKLALAIAALVPALSFAAATESWKLTGVTAKNKGKVIGAVAKATKGKVTLDQTTGTLTVTKSKGTIDGAAVAKALPTGVTVADSAPAAATPVAPAPAPLTNEKTAPAK